MVWSFSFRAFAGDSLGRVLAVLFCGGGTGCFFLVLEQLPELAGSGREKLNSKVVWPTAHLGGGTSNVHEDLERKLGSIPAWAGEPSGNRYGECLQPVYPRVGGGTIMAEEDAFCVPGLSPRGRGNLDCANRPTLYRGSIPAWAGEPPDLTPRSSQFSSFSSCRWYTIPPPRWPTFSPPLTAPASTRLYWP